MSQLKITLTQDGSHSLLNEGMNETYHSTHGAIQESTHVFIKNGLEYFLNENDVKTVNVFEVGFGTGLNALLALKFAEEKQIKIRFQSIEIFPIHWEIISQLNYPDRISFAEAENLFKKIHQCGWNKVIDISDYFSLQKTDEPIQSIELRKDSFDIVFFDAFAPAKQAEMWEITILEKVIQSLKSKGVFVTYCAKGQLKRDLKSIGLTVEALPGPPGKREMVRARKRDK